MAMKAKTEKEPLSYGKRKAIAIIVGILLVSFVAFMFYTGQIKKDDPTNNPTQNNDPVQQPTETPAENNPDDIGITEEEDADFLTGGTNEGVLGPKDMSKDLEDQAEIYSAVQAAEGAMWKLLNYGSDTDEKEREETLKTMFTKDTPVDLTLPSKQERKDNYGGSFEYNVMFHAKNGQGGDTNDYRVELIGTRETVTDTSDNIIMGEKETNGFNRIDSADFSWTVSLRQEKIEETGETYWLVYNYQEAQI